ncbi:MAG: sporulation integral membrane protein YtvI [Lachnospiraceae bacterium]|nr:sporulation integral membrane protein YtvI [Lachnospiraceae bacterium]
MREPYRKYLKVILNILTAIVILLLTVFLLPKVLGFFLPFVIGWIISMIANPLVRFLDEKIRIRRKAGSAIVIVAAIALVIGGGYWGISLLVREISGFVSELPELWNSMQSDFSHAGKQLETIAGYFPAPVQNQVTALVNALGSFASGIANNLSSPTVSAVGTFAKNIPSVFIGIIMMLLSAYFFIAEREEIFANLHKYIPEGLHRKGRILYDSLIGAVGGYFKAQFKIEIWMYVLLLIGFLILKIKHAALISFGIALLDFFPVFGTGTVLLPWAVIKILGGNYKMAIGLLIIWGFGQLARQLIQPKVVGDSVGVPALPTLFLLYIGYKLGGVGGMIIAVPVGLIIIRMYQAGFFTTTIDSVRILIHGFNHFRRLTDEDKTDIR